MPFLRVCHVLVLSSLAAIAPAAAAAQTKRAVDPRASVQQGNVQEFRIPSKSFGHDRRIWIYTPPGYAAQNHAAYDVVVAFDGSDYLSDVPLPMILDTLRAAGKAPPLVGILIDNASGAERLGDLANRAIFASFLGDEVMPWVRQRYNVTRDPHHTIVTGSSAGGLAAAYVALKRPDLFGKVLSQSGAFWRGNEAANGAPYEWLATQYAARPKLDVRLFLDVGALETHATLGGAGPVFIEASRRFRDVLKAKGYALTYTEVPGGVHAPESWKLRLPVGLAALSN